MAHQAIYKLSYEIGVCGLGKGSRLHKRVLDTNDHGTMVLICNCASAHVMEIDI